MSTTIYRISEEILKLLLGDEISVSSNTSINEIKISVCQVANQLLKTEHFTINEKMGERIPNGSVLGLYTEIPIVSYNGKSMSTLPVKPLKLPRNMGIFAIYFRNNTNENYNLDSEAIPLQMGQGGLLKSQPMINNLLGQTGYECFGEQIIFTKDLPAIFPNIVCAMRLAILDFSQYGDYDPLPLLPEQEWEIKKQVLALYAKAPIADKLVDSTTSQNAGVPLKQQTQS